MSARESIENLWDRSGVAVSTLLDAYRAEVAREVIPPWEVMYEPGNVSDYLIGYTNSEAAAKGAGEAWMQSQAEVTGRLEWVPDRPWDGYDQQHELIERHADGVDTGPGIFIRRMTDDAEAGDQP
ncbi:hypothetical protein [Streptomyces reniochalinae]|uniref:Uncharacterized protein n=1 Tax=Streptomyces reniochalinae TaxID=2250578 RepID=A0A367EUW9_9ACTN|nr:hypothetical protein [Streptomyces reniochalinae]RCG21801.1 hypothetical protein DQ392_08825 [Streptomyces reniochalinae]